MRHAGCETRSPWVPTGTSFRSESAYAMSTHHARVTMDRFRHRAIAVLFAYL